MFRLCTDALRSHGSWWAITSNQRPTEWRTTTETGRAESTSHRSTKVSRTKRRGAKAAHRWYEAEGERQKTAGRTHTVNGMHGRCALELSMGCPSIRVLVPVLVPYPDQKPGLVRALFRFCSTGTGRTRKFCSYGTGTGQKMLPRGELCCA